VLLFSYKDDNMLWILHVHYIDDVFSLNNSTLGNYANRIYHIEREIKDTTETSTLTYM